MLVEYGVLVKEELGYLGCEIEIESGCLIVGNVGIMVSKVIYVKEGEDCEFMIVDGVMNDLICFVMYEVYYDIILVVELISGEELVVYDIVGLVCEIGDIFVKFCIMVKVEVGDLIVFCFVGVYGVVMFSEYNIWFFIFEVLVYGD